MGGPDNISLIKNSAEYKELHKRNHIYEFEVDQKILNYEFDVTEWNVRRDQGKKWACFLHGSFVSHYGQWLICGWLHFWLITKKLKLYVYICPLSYVFAAFSLKRWRQFSHVLNIRFATWLPVLVINLWPLISKFTLSTYSAISFYLFLLFSEHDVLLGEVTRKTI